MNEVPTLREEINRKTVDALVWLQEGLDSGRLSADQVYVARQALFTAVAGLLDADINDLLTADPINKDQLRQEVFVKGNNIAILTLTDTKVRLGTTRIINPPAVQDNDCATFDKAQSVFSKAREKFVHMGFTPFN